MSLRAGKKFQREVSLQDPMGRDKDGNEISLLETLVSNQPAVCEQVEGILAAEKLQAALATALCPRERLVLELRYGLRTGEEMTQREIAAQLNISRSYISRIEKRALRKLREAMSSAE